METLRREQQVIQVQNALSYMNRMAHEKKDDELIDVVQAAEESFQDILDDATYDSLFDSASNWIETFTGKQFFFGYPTEDMICIEDIAHALSNICRYKGHVKKFYSVAEHSVLLASHVYNESHGKKLAKTMLLHDAAEAYIGDMPRPLKVLIPAFSALEKKIQVVITKKFDLVSDPLAYQKELDTRILVNERKDCMNSTTNKWSTDSLVPIKGLSITCLEPEQAETVFLQVYDMLCSKA